MYLQLLQSTLAYVSLMVTSEPTKASEAPNKLYSGLLRILLVLHRDFPEFLVANHYALCNNIPNSCTQTRNLILSAYPSSLPELPDPLTAGLKVDRLEEIRKPPMMRGDIEIPLRQAKVKDHIDSILHSSELTDAEVDAVVKIIEKAKQQDVENDSSLSYVSAIICALVLYVGTRAITSTANKGSTFDAGSQHAKFLCKLAHSLSPETRFHFISAIVNQLRYPNSHTHYFTYTLLHIFGNSNVSVENGNKDDKISNDASHMAVQQQITTLLIERLIVHRPHPWGLIITLLELLKNPNYTFWELDFMKAAPDVSLTLGTRFVDGWIDD